MLNSLDCKLSVVTPYVNLLGVSSRVEPFVFDAFIGVLMIGFSSEWWMPSQLIALTSSHASISQ